MQRQKQKVLAAQLLSWEQCQWHHRGVHTLAEAQPMKQPEKSSFFYQLQLSLEGVLFTRTDRDILLGGSACG